MTATHNAALDKAIAKLHFDSTSDDLKHFNDLNGKSLIVYFYPKDNTPGCTQQANDFKQAYTKLQAMNIEVIGVSRDSIRSHHNFINKYDLPFPLISDTDEIVCRTFDVIKLKKLYGREYLGIERSTFIINSDGKVQHEWRNVRAKGHVERVLQHLEQQ